MHVADHVLSALTNPLSSGDSQRKERHVMQLRNPRGDLIVLQKSAEGVVGWCKPAEGLNRKRSY